MRVRQYVMAGRRTSEFRNFYVKHRRIIHAYNIFISVLNIHERALLLFYREQVPLCSRAEGSGGAKHLSQAASSQIYYSGQQFVPKTTERVAKSPGA